MSIKHMNINFNRTYWKTLIKGSPKGQHDGLIELDGSVSESLPCNSLDLFKGVEAKQKNVSTFNMNNNIDITQPLMSVDENKLEEENEEKKRVSEVNKFEKALPCNSILMFQKGFENYRHHNLNIGNNPQHQQEQEQEQEKENENSHNSSPMVVPNSMEFYQKKNLHLHHTEQLQTSVFDPIKHITEELHLVNISESGEHDTIDKEEEEEESTIEVQIPESPTSPLVEMEMTEEQPINTMMETEDFTTHKPILQRLSKSLPNLLDFQKEEKLKHSDGFDLVPLSSCSSTSSLSLNLSSSSAPDLHNLDRESKNDLLIPVKKRVHFHDTVFISTTFGPLNYNRKGDLRTAIRDPLALRDELDNFKEFEMKIHEESRQYTLIYRTNFEKRYQYNLRKKLFFQKQSYERQMYRRKVCIYIREVHNGNIRNPVVSQYLSDINMSSNRFNFSEISYAVPIVLETLVGPSFLVLNQHVPQFTQIVNGGANSRLRSMSDTDLKAVNCYA